MKTIYNPLHHRHSGQWELGHGLLVPGFEMPVRAEYVRAAVAAAGLGPILPPDPYPLDCARRVHAPDYVDFLERAWAMWAAAGRHTTALPMAWPVLGLRADTPPRLSIDGLLGFYSFDGGAGFQEGTFEAVKAAHDCALTGATLIAEGESAAFALCRPPGHHAGRRIAGGYCYINNAAVAAQSLRDGGAARVAILDVDYHHGNGTQEIFYDRADVLFCSIHADPLQEYPYFLGHAGETGQGPGEGFNHNYPLPHGADFGRWGAALADACARIAAFAPEAIVVSLGVDTYEADPISQFKLTTADYPKIGAAIARLRRPTLFVLEGGYAVQAIGENVAGVLTGFAGG